MVKKSFLVLCLFMLLPMVSSWANGVSRDDIRTTWSEAMSIAGQSTLYTPWFIEKTNVFKTFVVIANVSAITDTLTIDLFPKNGSQFTTTKQLAPMVPFSFRPSEFLGDNTAGMVRVTGTEIVGITVRQQFVDDKPDLEGTILSLSTSSFVLLDEDGILQFTVFVDSNTLIEDDDDDIAFTDLQVGDEVEVTTTLDTSGNILATKIEINDGNGGNGGNGGDDH